MLNASILALIVLGGKGDLMTKPKFRQTLLNTFCHP